MKKDWWFKFEHLAWLTDEQLNRCSLETQGFWIRAICVMHKGATAKLIGTEAELVRLLSVTPSEFRRCVAELAATKAATVTQLSKVFTLMSRKFAKELKLREQGRLRKRRERCHARVTPKSQDRVKSKSNKKEIREEESTEEACVLSFPEQVLDGIRGELGILQLPNEPLWLLEIERAAKNGFTFDHCLETFRLMRGQHWRTGPIKPNTWAQNLPNLENLKREQNGTTKQPSEREKSAQRTINAELMADAIGRGDEEAVRRILASDGQGHLKGYLPG